jgi:uncharacterized protein
MTMDSDERRSAAPTFQTVLDRHISRRLFLNATGTVAGLSSVPWSIAAGASESVRGPSEFQPVAPQRADAIVLAKGYTYDLIARWGDSLFPGTPSLTGRDLLTDKLLEPGAGRRQERQFGCNCDAIKYFPAPGKKDRAVLCVNNEYVQSELAFRKRRDIGVERAEARRRWVTDHPQVVDVMKAAQGVSVIEIARTRGAWKLQPGAPLTRRITAETVCEIRGPARGAPLMRTKQDPEGMRARGTFANCAGGKTPWGTYLTAEENIDDYFGFAVSWSKATDDSATVEALRRFPLRDHSFYGWEHADPRFDVRQEPHEALRFGWIVEIDPNDPTATPRKRTALGRFSHEGANTTLTRDKRVAVYMGDDDPFEYVYKFVSRGAFDPEKPQANRDLLDDGTLYVARFDADGTGEWLPLVHDEKGPLNSKSGFASQADVVIKARAAGDILGATPMDRPEDIEPSPITGRVYIACTKGVGRQAGSVKKEWAGRVIDIGVNAANPRPQNQSGHVIELIEDGDDGAATRFRWSVFLLAGNPQAPGSAFLTRYEDVVRSELAAAATYYGGYREAGAVSPFACPDNLGIDTFGRLWIVTDSDKLTEANNGCFVCPTDGAERGKLRQLLSAPVGAEVGGCEFSPDGTTLFLSIQHPGEGGSVDSPISHWPDGGNLPARSAVVAVRREDGGPV